MYQRYKTSHEEEDQNKPKHAQKYFFVFCGNLFTAAPRRVKVDFAEVLLVTNMSTIVKSPVLLYYYCVCSNFDTDENKNIQKQ